MTMLPSLSVSRFLLRRFLFVLFALNVCQASGEPVSVTFDRVVAGLSREEMHAEIVSRDRKAKKKFSRLIAALNKVRRSGDANEADKNGTTPLMLAVQMGERGAAAWLLEQGADRFLKDKNGSSALDQAPDEAWKEFLEENTPLRSMEEAMSWLSRQMYRPGGEEIDTAKYDLLKTLLSEVKNGTPIAEAKAGNVNVLGAALDARADKLIPFLLNLKPGKEALDAAFPLVATPWAADVMLKAGADVNSEPPGMSTAIVHAASRYDRGMVDYLVAHGAHLRGDGKAVEGLLTLRLAERKARALGMLRFLLERGATPDAWISSLGVRSEEELQAAKEKYPDVFQVFEDCRAECRVPGSSHADASMTAD